MIAIPEHENKVLGRLVAAGLYATSLSTIACDDDRATVSSKYSARICASIASDKAPLGYEAQLNAKGERLIWL